MTQFTLHEKINLRSHFEASGSGRFAIPLSEKKLKEIRESGHTVKQFKSESYLVRIQGTKFNKKGSTLKH